LRRLPATVSLWQAGSNLVIFLIKLDCRAPKAGLAMTEKLICLVLYLIEIE